MSTPELLSYIQAQLQTGKDVPTITTELRNAGWAEADIQNGITSVLQPAPQPTQPLSSIQPAATAQTAIGTQQRTPQAIAKQTKYALIFAILSIVLYFVLLLAFQYVFVAIGLMGVYAAIAGYRVKAKLPLILGIIGAALNLITYIVSLFVH